MALGLVALGVGAACVPGGPVYLGPPISTLEGLVFSAETAAPVATAEICVFGADTACTRAGAEGTYRIQVYEHLVSIRFRGSGHAPAIVDSIRLVTDSTVVMNCGLTTRVLLSNRPVACLPMPRR